MDIPKYFAFILALSCLATVHAQDQAEPSNECATALVQVDDKGILSTSAHCGLSSQDAKAIEDAFFQIRHDLKPSFDQMRSLLAANNIILGAVLDHINAGEVSLEGVLKTSQLFADKGNAESATDLMAEAAQWKGHYESLMESLRKVGDTVQSDTNVLQALQRLDLDQASRLLDELIAAQEGKGTASAGYYYLRAQIYLLQFQPQSAVPLLEKARQMQPDNKEFSFANAKALQEQNSQGSAESLYTSLLDQYRALAKDNPAVYLPSVAATLNNLGMLYSESKRTSEAEKAYREAVEIRRGQAKDKPADLALSLNNLANLYRENQRLDEAEKAYREALEIRRSLARDEPAVYQRSVAATLINLGNIYRGGKRHGEAEKAYREALDTTRSLARDNPNAFRPDMAATLSNLGNLYSETKRPAEAEKALSEARDLQRELARSDPATYEPSLAMTQHNLGNAYSDAKRIDEAEKAYREALDIRTALAKDNPATYQPQVAMTLNNMAVMYRDSQHYDDAEKAYREALAVQRELYRADPEANAASLKTMLSGTAALMEKMGRKEDRAKIEAERGSIR